MNSASWSIHYSKFLYFIVFLVAILGSVAYMNLGRLEDPEFTIKTALILTYYPGATPAQVEEEVTDKIELKLQEMGEVKKIQSSSRDGFSMITVDIKDKYPSRAIKQIWDQLRKKVEQAKQDLPDTIIGPIVNDEFGDVYGIMLTVTGDGFTYAELKDTVDNVRKELLRVPEVAKVEIFGKQEERIYIEITRSKMAEMGISPLQAIQSLQEQNIVLPSGFLEMDNQQIRINTSGVLHSIDELLDLKILSRATNTMVYLRDLANIRRDYIDPPDSLMRFNGRPCLGLGIVPVEKANVVRMGAVIHEKIRKLEEKMPVGIEFGVASFQPDNVNTAVSEFIENLVEAVVIVLILLLFTLGLRMGFIVGIGAPITILITFITMAWMGIDLHRVSLGALIIAIGVLVDDSIVICDLILAKLERGMGRAEAACSAVKEVGMPLLYGTVIACLSFSPISLSNSATGEYCVSLFQVVTIALMISWLQAMTFTCLNAYQWVSIAAHKINESPYTTPFYRFYQGFLRRMLLHRFFTITFVVILLIAAGIGFTHVRQIFFPPASRPQFLVEYWRPEGVQTKSVASDIAEIEKHLMREKKIVSVTSFCGEGVPRFYLPLLPCDPNQSFAQLLINIDDSKNLDELMDITEKYLEENYPDAEPRVYPLQYGEPVRFPIEIRLSGEDKQQLRNCAEQMMAVLRDEPRLKNVRQDWRQEVPRALIQVDQTKCRNAGISSAGIAEMFASTFSEMPVSVFREKDKRIPIVWRLPSNERNNFSNLDTMMIWPRQGGPGIPLRQAADIQLRWDESMIHRRNRERTMTVQADVLRQFTPIEAHALIMPKIQKVALPEGVRMEWGGEYETSMNSQNDVVSAAPLALSLMVLILVWQFNSYRRPLIILFTVPLCLIGITIGMLLLNQPFGFMAMLGAMSLAGVIIRNTIVLLDEIDAQIHQGLAPYDAVIHASLTRVRPVCLAAMATVTGMIPLALSGPFWAPMAITIMFGLSFATLLTLGVVPVLYTVLFRIPIPKK